MHATSRFVVAALLSGAVLASAPALSAAPTATLRPGFDHITVPVPPTTLDVYPSQLGIPRTSNMMACNMDNRLTTRDPVVTFTVEEPTAALLTIEGEVAGLQFTGVAVMLPENRILCIREVNRYQSQVWPAGTYAMHFVANGKLTYDALLPVDIPEGGMRVEFHELTPRRMALDLTRGANPVHVAGLRHDQRVKGSGNFGVSCPEGGQTTEEPALVVDLAAPVKRLRVAIDAGSEGVIVTDAKGRSACSKRVWLARDYRYVDLEDVPAGPLAIRTAGPLQGGSREEQSGRDVWYDEPFGRPTFAVAIEDLSRPRDLPWGADDAPPVLALTGPMRALWQGVAPVGKDRAVATPDVDSVRIAVTKNEYNRELGSCRGFTRSEVPALILDAKRPMADVWYRAVSNRPLRVVVAGPFGEDGRPADGYTERCLAGGQQPRAGFGELDMAEYRVYLAQPKDAEPDDAVLVVGTLDTPVDRTAVFREPRADLAVADKALLPYFAMLPIDFNSYVQWSLFTPFERQDLVEKAPLSLFAYPKFDLDKASASYWGVDQRALDEAGVPVTYPKTDEPLLVLDVDDRGRAHVMTTDAAMMTIESKYLGAAPAGTPQVPTEVRNFILSWKDVVGWAIPEDAKEVARVEKAREKAEGCYMDYWDKHHGGVSGNLSLVTYVNGRVTSVRDYTAMVDDAATRKCGLRKVDALQGKVLKKLDQRLRKRGAEHLAEIAKRFAK
ncbi:MAG: hypothetical protein EP329_06385 [Deltaproteobacteria bacterium]|nr:MAG: hypothetical protein EP329_06385 [Deltaproteobacteria bacterium]